MRGFRGLFLGMLISVGAIAGARAQAVEIEYWQYVFDARVKAMNELIKRFEAANPNIKVKHTTFPYADYQTKIVAAAPAGQGPDVVQLFYGWVDNFIAGKVIRPLPRDAFPPEMIEKEFYPIVSAMKRDGEYYGLPTAVRSLALFYNKKIFQEAGLDPAKPPKTGEEFLEWAKKLTVKDGSGKVTRYGFELPNTWATARWIWFSLMYQFGGTFLDDKGLAAVDSEASQKALQYLVDLINVHGVTNPEVGGNKGEDAFASKQVAMKFIGPWEVNLRMAQKMNFMTAQLPVFGQKAAVWANSHCMAVSKQKSDDKLAADGTFMKWFFDNFAAPATTVGIIPQSKAVRESAAFTGTEQYKYFKSFVDDLPNIVYEPLIPQYLSVFSFDKPTPLVTNLQAALSGSKPVPDALKAMKEGLDAQLKKG
jgi:multiple sugar transport system substrate-binding protein